MNLEDYGTWIRIDSWPRIGAIWLEHRDLSEEYLVKLLLKQEAKQLPPEELVFGFIRHDIGSYTGGKLGPKNPNLEDIIKRIKMKYGFVITHIGSNVDIELHTPPLIIPGL